MNKWISYTFLAIVLLVTGIDADAQCAMCKLNAENAADNIDQDIGKGINRGILYLMGIPYALLMTLAIVFFREKIFTFIKR